MSTGTIRAMRLSYGKAGCAACHSGACQADQSYHAIAMPQIGPGKGDGFDAREDYGRERVTGEEADRCRFRTPTSRNGALVGTRWRIQQPGGCHPPPPRPGRRPGRLRP
jgi:cytochrome c peroxidase